MRKNRNYAEILGKDYMQQFLKITDVTEDGRIFRKGKEMKQHLSTSGHKVVTIYDYFERICTPKNERKT